MTISDPPGGRYPGNGILDRRLTASAVDFTISSILVEKVHQTGPSQVGSTSTTESTTSSTQSQPLVIQVKSAPTTLFLEDKTWTTGISSLNRTISLISNMQPTRKFQLEEQSKVLRVKGRDRNPVRSTMHWCDQSRSGPVEKSGSTKPDIGKTAVTFPFFDFGYTASKLKDLLMGTDPDTI